MDEPQTHQQPPGVAGIVADTAAMNFTMISAAKVGVLLSVLAGRPATTTADSLQFEYLLGGLIADGRAQHGAGSGRRQIERR
jgi:hypothetical protein